MLLQITKIAAFSKFLAKNFDFESLLLPNVVNKKIADAQTNKMIHKTRAKIRRPGLV